MAQVDYFLKIDGIDGESDDDQFPKWIQIKSWSWGATNAGPYPTGTGSGGGKGKVSLHDLNITAVMNAASVSISSACTTGKSIAWIELDVRRAGDTPQVFMKIKLTDVLVSSYKTGGSSEDIEPTDHFTLNYGKIETSYGVQNDQGKVNSLDKKMSHDLRTNKPGG